ncbi:cell adhesion molecule [Sarcoptes scabiei]|nr:cell adhesion molecule [Sarcoptes scabiei]
MSRSIGTNRIIVWFIYLLSGIPDSILSSNTTFENEFTNRTFEELSSNNNNNTREGRTFLSELSFLRPTLFNIVRFPNEECLDASNQSGTCYTALECKKLGGNPSSKCARGLGTCCIMSRTCHNSTYNKVVYFKNPSYPLTDSEQNFCDLTINVIDADICQLKIDFLEFQIDPPIEGNCIGDKFTATASGMTPTVTPILCGNNRNQHMYLSLPANQEPRSVSIVFETNAIGDYRFHLKITQIDCRVRQSSLTPNLFSSVSSSVPRESRTIYQKIPYQLTFAAPTGCLQYFTQPIGTIESFNFGHYLNNLDYAICIERQPDTCRVIYSSTDTNFGIESSQTGTMPGVGDQLCANDYLLLVGGSKNGEGITKDRYCGGKLAHSSLETTETPVITKANGPIVIRFHSDQNFGATLKEGFRVKYEQSPTDCAVANTALTDNQLTNPNSFNPPPVVTAMLKSDKSQPIKLASIFEDESRKNNEKYESKQINGYHFNKIRSIRSNGKRLIF